jgi:hypothetical protein
MHMLDMKVKFHTLGLCFNIQNAGGKTLVTKQWYKAPEYDCEDKIPCSNLRRKC